MSKSSGILVYRFVEERIEFLLLKPGGPFYKKSEIGIWTIPKGEIIEGEMEVETAKREFSEETGFLIDTDLEHLGEFKLRKGKKLVVFITHADFDVDVLVSKEFEMEYPKNSKQLHKFPEIEIGRWMTLEQAQIKISPKQLPILDRVIEKLRI